MVKMMNRVYVGVILLFFTHTSFAADKDLSGIFDGCIEEYEQKIHAGCQYPIEFNLYKEGYCEGNVNKIIRELENDTQNERPKILHIERVDAQGNRLPFLPKSSRHYYNFDKSCLQYFHYLNQQNWPYELICLNQCMLYLFGYHAWLDHFVVLHEGKIYDIDTKSNGVSLKSYLENNYIEKRHPELLSQYRVSVFPHIDNYLEFAACKKIVQSLGAEIQIDATDLDMQVPLKIFLERF